MAVYIDNARIRNGSGRVCHMYADTLDELHTMAYHVGLGPVHFQKNTARPHYVVPTRWRQIAILNGAKPLNSRSAVLAVLAKLRNK